MPPSGFPSLLLPPKKDFKRLWFAFFLPLTSIIVCSLLPNVSLLASMLAKSDGGRATKEGAKEKRKKKRQKAASDIVASTKGYIEL